MGIYSDCRQVLNDQPGSTLTALEREVLYARIRAFSVRTQFAVWNAAATVLLYLFDRTLFNEYLYRGWYHKLIVFHCFQLVSIVSYFMTSLSDPGHIPVNKNENALFYKPDSEDGDDAQRESNGEYVKEAWNKNIAIDPNNAPFNFCWRCKFVRPIRSKHCYDCDRCIAKFDHHCPMIGTCVGGKNHRYFVTFLCSQSVVVLWCFQVLLMDLYDKYHSIISHRNADSDSEQRIELSISLLLRLAFFVSMFFAMFIVVGLCGYHCYLSWTNQTTYEMVKPHILEKWVKEENKRKLKYLRTHPQHGQHQAVDIHDVDDQQYRSKQDNNMISFHEGYLANLYLFWFAKLKPQWIQPLNCILKDSESSDASDLSDQDH